MMERPTGVHIAKTLREITKDWNLDVKVAAVVHSNASLLVICLKIGVTYPVLDIKLSFQFVLV